MSTGERVASDVAALVIVDHRITGVGDALFDNTPSQTFRYVDDACAS